VVGIPFLCRASVYSLSAFHSSMGIRALSGRDPRTFHASGNCLDAVLHYDRICLLRKGRKARVDVARLKIFGHERRETMRYLRPKYDNYCRPTYLVLNFLFGISFAFILAWSLAVLSRSSREEARELWTADS
jgi:hypothetical protein